MRVLILHAYSADNAGDGLLVQETLELVREALGEPTEITMLASRPNSFSHLPVRVHNSVPSMRGYDRAHLRVLRSIDTYDLVVGVGGGYLRTGTPKEAAKTILVQGPQLWAAAHTRTPSMYLPQSVGPARFGTRAILRRMLSKVDSVSLRDDRSMEECGGTTSVRRADLATSRVLAGRQAGVAPAGPPVISIRAVRGVVSGPIYELTRNLGVYDSYVQSTTGGNDDRPASATLRPRRIVERSELMTPGETPRVVVAVRLHAALMALAAGHYVIHLAYERKGFGAYGDLGLPEWVHNVNSFDESMVRQQVQELMNSDAARARYDASLVDSGPRLASEREEIMLRMRSLVRTKGYST